jgi:hypothetical protein
MPLPPLSARELDSRAGFHGGRGGHFARHSREFYPPRYGPQPAAQGQQLSTGRWDPLRSCPAPCPSKIDPQYCCSRQLVL